MLKAKPMRSREDRTDMAIAKAPASAWYALVVLIATTLFAFVDRQIINLVAPTFQKMLGLNDFELGALNGLGLALFASMAGYPIGWLADRFGRRLIFGFCIALWSISTAACAFQHDFAGLFVATAGIAIGEAALSPIVFSIVPDLFPERQRNTANFIYFGAVLLGAAAGLGLGGVMLGWLGAHHRGLPAGLASMDAWRVALILVALPAPLFLALLATVRMTARPSGATARGAEPKAADTHRLLPFVRAHWPVFGCLFGAIAAYNVPLNSAFIWLPLAMPRVFGTAPSALGLQLGLTVGLGTIAGLILPPLGSLLLVRDAALGALRLSFFFPLIAMLSSLILLIAGEPWQVYAAAGAQLTFALAIGALMPGLLQQIAPPHLRSRLIAILGIVQAMATGLSPLLVGAISDRIGGRRGILEALVIVGVPSWAIVALLLVLARRPFRTAIAAVGGGEAARHAAETDRKSTP